MVDFTPFFQNPHVLVQGITGVHGSFHTKAMLAAGTKVIAGVTPGKGGQNIEGVPVYSTIREALNAHKVDVSIVFVPPQFAAAALNEAMDNNIRWIICITEGIPAHDMLQTLQRAKEVGTNIIGPNCPGVLVPGQAKLGIIPASVGLPGATAIVSRSGTLTYEAAAGLSAAGIGQRIIVGIGGDALQGVDFVTCLEAFEADTRVTYIVLIGEIGGQAEQLAAEYIREYCTKPVFAYIVGQSAPPQTQLGHAGAIMGSEVESAIAKTKALKDAGAHVAQSLPELFRLIRSFVEELSTES